MPEAVIAEASREMAATIEGEVAMSEEARAALLRTTQKVFDRLFEENKTIEARLSVKRALIQEEEQARREAVTFHEWYPWLERALVHARKKQAAKAEEEEAKGEDGDGTASPARSSGGDAGTPKSASKLSRLFGRKKG